MLNNELLKNTIEEALKLGVQKVEQRNDPKIGHTYGAHIRSLASVKTDTDEPLNMVMDVLFAQKDMHSLIGSIPDSMPTTEFSLYGDGSVSIAAHWVANWLLAKSLSLPGGTEEAVNKLADFISFKSVKGMRVVVVAGVSVPDIIQLNEGIAVYPIEYLPPALGRDSLFAFCEELRYYLPRAERSPYPALTAVVKGFDMAPAVFSPPSHTPDWATRFHEDFDYLISIATAFSLLDEPP